MPPAIERAIGRLLRGVRAGDRHLAWDRPGLRGAPASIVLTSPAFVDGGAMPLRCAGAGVGDNRFPPLAWANLPAGTAELVLLLEDPDAPLPRPVVHLIAVLPPALPGLDEGALAPGAGIRFGRGAFGRIGYAGPRPPRGHGPHRYIFSLYALSRPLPAGVPDFAATLAGMAGNVLARGRLVGMFERA
jgi:Raf kinase inhibitor-like YbhB/YbcL family protein